MTVFLNLSTVCLVTLAKGFYLSDMGWKAELHGVTQPGSCHQSGFILAV